MQRHIRAEMLHHPLGQRFQLGIGIIFAGNQQGGDLEPDRGFLLQVQQSVEHHLQVTTADLPVEIFAEGLQIDVGGVHVAEELAARLLAHIAGSHRYRANAVLAAGNRGIDGIFHEDDRIVIGVGDAAAAQLMRHPRQLVRRSGIGQGIHFARLAHVPVLAELAGQIAAGSAKRQHRRTRQEMVERLFLDRIDAKAAGTAITGQDDPAVVTAAHKAQALLALVQLAIARADIALQPPVIKRMPVLGRKEIGGYRIHGRPPRSKAPVLSKPAGWPRLCCCRASWHLY